MRSGRVLLAVALTVGMGAAGFSDDGSSQSAKSQQATKLDASWSTGQSTPGTLRRTVSSQSRHGMEKKTVHREPGSVVQAAAVGVQQKVKQVSQEEVIDFGPLDDNGPFTAPKALPGAGQAQPLAAPSAPTGEMFAPINDGAAALQKTTSRSLYQPPANRPRSLSNQPQPLNPAPNRGIPVSTISSPMGALQAQPVSSVLDIASTGTGSVAGGPLVSVKVERKGTISIGQESQCSFVVRNNGSGVAGNVILEAYVPNNVQVTGTTPGTSEQGALTWTLGELQPGQERTVQVSMVPRTAGSVKVQSFVRYSGQQETTFKVVEPKLKVTLAGPKDAKVGEAAPYVITVTNPGSGTAQNVTISAKIPKGLEHRRGDHLTMQVGALGPGESRNVRLALTASDAGRHPIRVEAIADQNLNDSANALVAVVAPMLGLQIVGPKVRHAGRRGQYTLVVSNPGNVAASNIRTKYAVPTGFEFVEADRGGRASGDGNVEWFVGQLAPGQTSKLNVVLRAKSLGNFTHKAGVVSEQGATKSAEMPTTVTGVASLAVTIQDRDDPVEVGQETLYEVRVANEGSMDARNVILTCDIPNGLKVTSVRGPVNYYNRNGQVVFEAVKALPAGKSNVYQILVTASSGGSKKLRARVVSDTVREPLTSEELTKVYSD
ncbi:MAG: hypothetical protein AB8G99_27360 [Planctomycetaceae bacterium]